MDLLALDRTTILPMALTEREMHDARGQAGTSGPIPEVFNEGEDELPGVAMRGSWLQRVLHGAFYYGIRNNGGWLTGTVELRYATRLNGSDYTCAEDAVDEGLWRMQDFDPDTCGASSLYIPVSPWPQSTTCFSLSFR